MPLGDRAEDDFRRVADPELLREWMEEDEFEDGSDELDWLLNAREAQGAIDAEAAASLRQAQELVAGSERDYQEVAPVVEGLLARCDAEDDGRALAGTMAAARNAPRVTRERVARKRAARMRSDLAKLADQLPSDLGPAA